MTDIPNEELCIYLRHAASHGKDFCGYAAETIEAQNAEIKVLADTLRKSTKYRVEESQRLSKYIDYITRLVEFSAYASLAYRDDDADLITEAFRALPDDLQEKINKMEEYIEGQQEEDEDEEPPTAEYDKS